ncbi:MAG: hydroxymethylglutaryl-CoA lyase [Phycisphaerales bacterium JB039]
MRQRVRITDVAPRDGLQNEPAPIPTAQKVELVRALMGSGVDEVEVSSFVSPKWVPQLGDAAEVFAAIAGEKPPGVTLSALVPNERGMAAALAVNQRAGKRVLDKIAVFTAASETFSQRNTNASIAETIERFRPVVRLARAQRLAVRAYISCAIACPFEGPTGPAQLQAVIRMLEELGPDEIDLGDTIGAATPETLAVAIGAARVSCAWAEDLPETAWVVHLHDTFGRAAACVRAALDVGVRSFDGAAGGLGGCPYVSTAQRRAPGNIATETLVATVEEAGFATGVNGERLAAAGALAQRIRGGAAGGAA